VAGLVRSCLLTISRSAICTCWRARASASAGRPNQCAASTRLTTPRICTWGSNQGMVSWSSRSSGFASPLVSTRIAREPLRISRLTAGGNWLALVQQMQPPLSSAIASPRARN